MRAASGRASSSTRSSTTRRRDACNENLAAAGGRGRRDARRSLVAGCGDDGSDTGDRLGPRPPGRPPRRAVRCRHRAGQDPGARARSPSASSSTSRRSASRTRKTGEVEGFDVDLGQAVADALGVKPKFIEAISDNRIPFLQDGTADLILSTMTINEERVGQINFSDPYFIARGRILVKAGNGDDHRRRRPGRQERLHGARLDLRGNAEKAGARRQAQARRHLLGVPGADPERLRRRGLDRRRDPDRHDHPDRRRARARRRRADAGALRRRHQEGRQAVDRLRQRGVLRQYKEDGRWKQTYDKWVGQYTKEDAGAAGDLRRRGRRARQGQRLIAERRCPPRSWRS